MSRPLEIADSLDAYAGELRGIDPIYFQESTTLETVAFDIRRLTPPAVRRWSDPRSWPSGKVPTRNDNVTIDRDILIDVAECRRLDIVAGTATLAPEGKLEIFDGSVVVWRDAAFRATTGDVLFHVTNDRLFVGNTRPGPRPDDPDDHSDTDYGLWALEGSTVVLDGPPMLSWTWAETMAGAGTQLGYGVVAFPAIGTDRATLGEVPVGWQPGDTLLLAGVNGGHVLTTLLNIQGPDGRQIVFLDTTRQFNALARAGMWLFPKIANLSRRLRIISADVKEGDVNHRAHTIFMHHGHFHARNVELRNLGTRGKLGRYPVHFHHAGHAHHGSGIENCSIWQDVADPGSRFVSIHNSQGVICKGNVGFRSRGHGYFMEDGREAGCNLSGNLSVGVVGPEELPVKHSNIEPSTHHYWPFEGNVFEGNVAVGGDASGLIMLPTTTKDDTCVVKNFEAFGCAPYGMWSKCERTVFENCTSAYAGSSGIAVFPPPFGFPMTSTEILNPVLWLNGTTKTSRHPYQVGINISGCSEVVVRGGQIANRNEAFHAHYPDAWATLENVDIEADFLAHPTYWECPIRIIGGKQTFSKQMVIGPYPAKRNTFSFLAVDGKFYVGPASAIFFPGATPQIYNSAYLLPGPLPPSGFILAPAGGVLWTIRPAGSTAASKRLWRAEKEDCWRESLGTWRMGYPHGMPPGRYEVAFYDRTDTPLAAGTVEVRSGEVVSLP